MGGKFTLHAVGNIICELCCKKKWCYCLCKDQWFISVPAFMQSDLSLPFSCLWIMKNNNLSYTGGLFHCYMLDESICHFRGVMSILSLLFYF